MSSPASIHSIRSAWGRTAPDLRARAGLVAAVVAYAAVFHLSYHMVIRQVFEFWGFGGPPVPWPYTAAAWILSVLPAFWIPPRCGGRPSSFSCCCTWCCSSRPPASFLLLKPALPPVEALAR